MFDRHIMILLYKLPSISYKVSTRENE